MPVPSRLPKPRCENRPHVVDLPPASTPLYNFVPISHPRTTAVLTYASLSGGGCLWETDWMYVNWALDYPSLCSLHINYKETFTIVLAAHRWAPCWSGHRIVVKTDSQVAAAILNKGTTCFPVIMDWIRSLFWLKEYYNFSLLVKHIPGSINTLADSVSRLDVNVPSMALQILLFA